MKHQDKAPTKPQPVLLLSKAEAAAMLGISLRTIETLLFRNPCPVQTIKAGARRLVVKASLEEHVRRCQETGANLLTG